jgi:tape measure domain-containing protein
MPEVTQLVLSVDSRQVKNASGDLDRLSRSGQSAEKEAGALTRAYQGFGRAIGAVGLAVFSREVIQAADAYKNMNSRLQLVTSSMAELATAQQGVFDISQRTRVGLGETTDLFTSLARSTKTLGVSQEDLLKVTEGINQALIISGTSASSAQAALVQLGQGFASGTLRGEELNSVLEQVPRLSQAIADGLGVPQGELRKLGQEGQLTAEKVFRALQKSSTSLKDEFSKMPLTVEQATTQVGTSISRLIGIIDKATGATGLLASAISGIALGVDNLIDQASNIPIVRAQAKVDALRQQLIIMMQSRTAEHPSVKLLQKQLDDAAATLKNLKADMANNQSAAETARLGRRPTTVIGPNLATISGIETRLKELKELRENATLGSAEFKRYTGEIKSFEEQLKKLNPSTRQPREKAQEVFLNYQDQIKQRIAGLFESSSVVQAQTYMDTLKELDSLYFDVGISAELYESALAQLTGATSSASDTTSDFLKNQERLKELLTDTDLEGQRQDMELLTQALMTPPEQGGITTEQYLEAVSRRLGLVGGQLKETKSFADELGLSFASAFEDATVEGGKLSDMLKGLADDILRMFIRQQVTKPLANAVGGLINSLFPGVTPNAKGGIYNSPGLSAYSGSIVSTPTLFPFARGAGLMGEAGPEAILPLSRGKDGKLGVAGGGGASVVINVNSSGGSPLHVTEQNRTVGADGTLTIDLLVRAMESSIGDSLANRSGPVARGLESGYGIRPSIS